MDGWIDRSEVVGGGDGDGDHVVLLLLLMGIHISGLRDILTRMQPRSSSKYNSFLEREETRPPKQKTEIKKYQVFPDNFSELNSS